jgi:hypothetical protein
MLSKLVVALLVVLCLASLASRMARAATVAGEFVAVGGAGFIEANSRRTPIKVGDAVHVGDIVEVTSDGRAKLRMTDGSILSLAAGTRLLIGAFEVDGTKRRESRLSLISGLLRAVVATFHGPSRFEIDTLTGVAAVRSTDWFIEARPDSTQVGVLDGRVRLISVATGRQVTIAAGHGARVAIGGDPLPPRVWAQSEFDEVIRRTTVN